MQQIKLPILPSKDRQQGEGSKNAQEIGVQQNVPRGSNRKKRTGSKEYSQCTFWQVWQLVNLYVQIRGRHSTWTSECRLRGRRSGGRSSKRKLCGKCSTLLKWMCRYCGRRSSLWICVSTCRFRVRQSVWCMNPPLAHCRLCVKLNGW